MRQRYYGTVCCTLLLLSVPSLVNTFMKVFLLVALFTALNSQAQSSDETAIRHVLQTQTDTWNRGDINGFMQTYWKSDSLMFIGSNGVVWGWQQTLDNYKKRYPDKMAMGTLSFAIIEVRKLSSDYYFVSGKWMLRRAADAPSGYYTLLLRKIDGAWQIVSDHSS